MKNLDSEIDEVARFLEEKQKNFDKVMDMSRAVVRTAGQSITLLHNNEKDSAKKKLAEMKRSVDSLKKIDGQFRYQTLQAYQEYTEAFAFYTIKVDKKIPCREEIDVDFDAYLLGLMDVVGELKREILEALRKDDIKSAEWYLDTMKQIYDSTRSLRFAEAVLQGFRKKQDVARIQLENAGSEILQFKSSRR